MEEGIKIGDPRQVMPEIGNIMTMGLNAVTFGLEGKIEKKDIKFTVQGLNVKRVVEGFEKFESALKEKYGKVLK